MAYPRDIGSIPLSGAIGLTSATDSYATFIDQLGQGGLQTIDTVANRDLIPLDRRSFGMLVSVSADPTPANDVIYILANTDMGGNSNTLTDNLNWLVYAPSGLTLLTDGHLFVGDATNTAVDVVVSGDLTLINTGAFTIANNAVTYAKMQAVTTNRLLGSGSGTSVAEITLGTGLYFTGTTLNASGTGDVTQEASGTQTANTITFWTGNAKELANMQRLQTMYSSNLPVPQMQTVTKWEVDCISVQVQALVLLTENS